MSATARTARLRKAQARQFKQADDAFYAAMRRGEEHDARALKIAEDTARWAAEQPAWFGGAA